jgi:hypothetical protein
MKTRLCSLTLLICGVSLPELVCGQAFLGHYSAGVEGLKAATLPPPGVYFRDYNYLYWSEHYRGGPPEFELLAYVQAPRLIWITDCKVLGGYYGADILVPFVYQNLEFTGFDDSRFGLGDIFVEPITLSWHPKQWDLAVGYGFWAPSGDYDRTDLTSPGKGFWSHMFTAGLTYYPDKDKTWSISALNRYEIHHENDDWDITPGQTWTLEGGIGKALTKTIEVGVVGYYQLQTTSDSGPNASDAKDHVIGVGPEINMVCPRLNLITSIRYLREVGAHDRPEGNTLNITFTRRF